MTPSISNPTPNPTPQKKIKEPGLWPSTFFFLHRKICNTPAKSISSFFFKYKNKNCIKLYVLFRRLQFLLNSITWIPSRFPKINLIYSFLTAVETSIKYLYNNLSIIPILI